MKFDKHQVRLIIGLVFVAIMFLAIYFVELKIDNQKKINNEYENSRINETNFSDLTQLY